MGRHKKYINSDTIASIDLPTFCPTLKERIVEVENKIQKKIDDGTISDSDVQEYSSELKGYDAQFKNAIQHTSEKKEEIQSRKLEIFTQLASCYNLLGLFAINVDVFLGVCELASIATKKALLINKDTSEQPNEHHATMPILFFKNLLRIHDEKIPAGVLSKKYPELNTIMEEASKKESNLFNAINHFISKINPYYGLIAHNAKLEYFFKKDKTVFFANLTYTLKDILSKCKQSPPKLIDHFKKNANDADVFSDKMPEINKINCILRNVMETCRYIQIYIVLANDKKDAPEILKTTTIPSLYMLQNSILNEAITLINTYKGLEDWERSKEKLLNTVKEKQSALKKDEKPFLKNINIMFKLQRQKTDTTRVPKTLLIKSQI